MLLKENEERLEKKEENKRQPHWNVFILATCGQVFVNKPERLGK